MTMQGRTLTVVSGVIAGLTAAILAFGTPASASRGDFTEICNDWSQTTTAITRSEARSYAYIGAGEGYQWGGGCWNDNNHDDTPDEGPDCSGFTFKSWHERSDTGDPWFRYHSWMRNTHGPYTAASFKNGVGAPNMVIGKSIAVFMDAFASSDHIGMIYWANTAYNQDRIIEAKCNECGTGTWPRTYRSNPDYSGVRRRHWS